MKHKLLSLVTMFALAMSTFLVFGCSPSSQNAGSSNSTNNSANSSAQAGQSSMEVREFSADELKTGIHHATIEVQGYGSINVELDGDSAPISVTNFIDLANKGYYNGLAFYRVVQDFCLQGGPYSTASGSNDASVQNITGEFSENNVDNPLAEEFKRGTIAMARSTHPDSASSTFFITLAEDDTVSASLNGKYAAFGIVDEAGMQVVDEIVAAMLPYATGNMGIVSDSAEQPVITSITVTD